MSTFADDAAPAVLAAAAQEHATKMEAQVRLGSSRPCRGEAERRTTGGALIESCLTCIYVLLCSSHASLR